MYKSILIFALVLSLFQYDRLFLDGHEVSTKLAYRDANMEESFLEAVGMDRLTHRIFDMNQAGVEESFCSLAPSQCQPGRDVFAFWAFSSDSTPQISLSVNKIHGLLAVYTTDGVPQFGYFRKDQWGSFNLEMDGELKSDISVDMINVFHFRSTGYIDLLSATIYHFIAPLPTSIQNAISQNKDHEIYSRMIQSPDFTEALKYSDYYYGGIASRMPIPRTCGRIPECPLGREDCNALAGFICNTGGGCLLENYNEAVQENAYNLNFADLDAFRSIRDEFLMRGPCAARYVSLYYQFSPFMKLNLSSLVKYATVMPKITAAADRLRSGNPRVIILDDDLYYDLIGIIEQHRDVENEEFQAALDELTSLLGTCRNMKANAILDMLSQ